jgi:hypothetical protein
LLSIKIGLLPTVHKPGLTFVAALDVSQVLYQGKHMSHYHLRSLEGIFAPLHMNGISNDQDVMDYSLNKASDSF